MGKTTLAMNFAVHRRLRGGHPVAVFTLEMFEHQLVQRILASEAQVDAAAHRRVQPSGLEAHRRAGGPALPDPALSRRQRQLERRRSSQVAAAEAPAGQAGPDRHRLLAAHGGAAHGPGEQPGRGRRHHRGPQEAAKELSLPGGGAGPALARRREEGSRPILSTCASRPTVDADQSPAPTATSPRAGRNHESAIGQVSGLGPVDTVEVLFQKEFSRFVNLDHQ